MHPSPPTETIHIRYLCTGAARRLQLHGRSVLTGIGKQPREGPVAVHRLGLDGDEQADLSVHGGLDKAVYAYPVAHYAFWQAQRQAQGVSLFDEALPPGFVGENLGIDGPPEAAMFVGDTWHFADCVLRVTAPREPCYKFSGVMGYAQAGRDMAAQGLCGCYLAVVQAGTLRAGEVGRVVPGQRALSIAQALRAKWAKHRR
ncbi:MOSC domain-containing protein [Acidovorax lacteus]|uniref:MOSC domain-containing protein n=1 Tax=Acidovorax lacteus TaxID=1924988 RepID=A0ABP8LC15_9BURK